MKTQLMGKGILDRLLEKGVRIPCPESVEIGPEVDADRISGDGVVIHSGCRLYGADTLILPGVELGSEAPATIHNCQVGKGVRLKGGFFHDACFLDGAAMGSGAQIREGCLLEEGARGAHTVGLKQTILFPFVTLGSLINFCDCLMAGGTDEKNHSEVGSSYIHFNYTPNQDKATASLIGDVPRGVMMNQPPVFLGGQGALVGPVCIAYGTVVAAGTIVRKDILRRNTMLLGHTAIARSVPFHRGQYGNIGRILRQNTLFLANLIALRRWYLDVRSRFMTGTRMEKALFAGAVAKIDMALSERLKRLQEVAERMPAATGDHPGTDVAPDPGSLVHKKRMFREKWPQIRDVIEKSRDLKGNPSLRAPFLEKIEKRTGRGDTRYLDAIRGLDADAAAGGTAWLQGLVDAVMEQVSDLLPGFRISGR